MGNICENIELYKTSGCPGDDGEDYRLLGCGTMQWGFTASVFDTENLVHGPRYKGDRSVRIDEYLLELTSSHHRLQESLQQNILYRCSESSHKFWCCKHHKLVFGTSRSIILFAPLLFLTWSRNGAAVRSRYTRQQVCHVKKLQRVDFFAGFDKLTYTLFNSRFSSRKIYFVYLWYLLYRGFLKPCICLFI